MHRRLLKLLLVIQVTLTIFTAGIGVGSFWREAAVIMLGGNIARYCVLGVTCGEWAIIFRDDPAWLYFSDRWHFIWISEPDSIPAGTSGGFSILGFKYFNFGNSLLNQFGIAIPAWLPPPLLLLGVYLCHRRLKRVTSLNDTPRCRQCGYDLRATPNRCPECGTVPCAASTQLLA